jgi:hypothetical protein
MSLEQGARLGAVGLAADQQARDRLDRDAPPPDLATFRHPQTGAEIKAIIEAMLKAPPRSGDPAAQQGVR